MSLNLKYDHPEYTNQFINDLLLGILGENTLMSVATVRQGRSYINTAYFCFNERLDVFFLSSPDSQHVLNLAENNSAALSIYNSGQEWDKPKKGIQLFGTCEQAEGMKILEGGKLYMQRFSGLKKWITHLDDLTRNVIHSKLYVCHIDEIKVFHDEVLGEREFLLLKPTRE